MSLKPNILDKYKNNINFFIETGTFYGGSLETALLAGFKAAKSIEVSEKLATRAQARFVNDPRIEIIHGDTTAVLGPTIDSITERMFFWLDANDIGNFPLLKELSQIQAHLRNDHTILIDDMRCAGTEAFEYVSRESIEAAVYDINPDYTITYEENCEMPGVFDILVAQLSPTIMEEG